MKRILACDPGKTNFAYAVMEYDPAASKRKSIPVGRVVQRGIIHSTLNDMTSTTAVSRDTAVFRGAINQILAGRTVNAVIAERYMLRRGAGGNTIELVNQMIGMLRCLEAPIRMIPASQWKNAANSSGHDLEAFYKEANAGSSVKVLDPTRITVHECDAAHIGTYLILEELGLPFDNFDIASSVLDATCVHIGVASRSKKRRPQRKSKRV